MSIDATGKFEAIEADHNQPDLSEYVMPGESQVSRNESAAVTRYYPELNSVIKKSEATNVSHEMTSESIDASFAAAQDLIVSHLKKSISALPAEMQEAVYASLDLPQQYKQQFPLYSTLCA
ncbi:MAG: hypothetical protein IAF58_23220 [Leptolyngbya sp.]|nr:hypothetical protein [Candidatus Melainabacteria bacterium]